MTSPIPELWTPAEVARYAKLTEEQLRQLRKSGLGPQYVKLGARVRYVPGICHKWILANLQTSTKETAK